MLVLGLNLGLHDGAAPLFDDYNLIAAMQQEPIVNAPQEAIAALRNNKVDFLVTSTCLFRIPTVPLLRRNSDFNAFGPLTLLVGTRYLALAGNIILKTIASTVFRLTDMSLAHDGECTLDGQMCFR